jgi:hypothetical protein
VFEGDHRSVDFGRGKPPSAFSSVLEKADVLDEKPL